MSPQLIVTVIVLAPLLGAIIAGLFGRRIGDVASMTVTTGLLFLSCALGWLTFVNTVYGDWHFTYQLASFIDVGAFKSAWSVRVVTIKSGEGIDA